MPARGTDLLIGARAATRAGRAHFRPVLHGASQL
jgi:hypothetical protein